MKKKWNKIKLIFYTFKFYDLWLKDSLTERLHFHFSLSCIGERNATHSSFLAWGIPGMAEPGGLPSMGSHRVGHDWRDLAAAAAE